MLKFPNDTPIYLRTGATDMRKSINGLSAIVQNDMNLNPFKSGYFLFCNKTRHLLKLLYWDKTGFALWYLCKALHNSHYEKKRIMRRK